MFDAAADFVARVPALLSSTTSGSGSVTEQFLTLLSFSAVPEWQLYQYFPVFLDALASHSVDLLSDRGALATIVWKSLHAELASPQVARYALSLLSAALSRDQLVRVAALAAVAAAQARLRDGAGAGAGGAAASRAGAARARDVLGYEAVSTEGSDRVTQQMLGTVQDHVERLLRRARDEGERFDFDEERIEEVLHARNVDGALLAAQAAARSPGTSAAASPAGGARGSAKTGARTPARDAKKSASGAAPRGGASAGPVRRRGSSSSATAAEGATTPRARSVPSGGEQQPGSLVMLSSPLPPPPPPPVSTASGQPRTPPSRGAFTSTGSSASTSGGNSPTGRSGGTLQARTLPASQAVRLFASVPVSGGAGGAAGSDAGSPLSESVKAAGPAPGAFIVETVAGSSGVAGAEDGDREVARFCTPGGLCLADSGRTLLVADTGNHRIRRVQLDSVVRRVSTLAGSGRYGCVDGDAATACFAHPQGLVVMDSGVDDDGDGDGTDGEAAPAPTQYVFVADALGCAIRVLALPDGDVSTLVGASSARGHCGGTFDAARVYKPHDLACVPGARALYVVDDFGVFRVELEREQVDLLAGAQIKYGHVDGALEIALFNKPHGVAALGERVIFVADTHNHCVRKIDLVTRRVLTLAGSGMSGHADGPAQTACFHYPLKLAVDAVQGHLYVSEASECIRRVDILTGAVTTIAGRAGSVGHVDGLSPAVRFSGPQGISLDAGRRILYVADAGNQVIRAINLNALRGNERIAAEKRLPAEMREQVLGPNAATLSLTPVSKTLGAARSPAPPALTPTRYVDDDSVYSQKHQGLMESLVQRVSAILDELTPTTLKAIGRFLQPPVLIFPILDALCLLLDARKSDSWKQARELFLRPTLREQMAQLQPHLVPLAKAAALHSQCVRLESMSTGAAMPRPVQLLLNWVLRFEGAVHAHVQRTQLARKAEPAGAVSVSLVDDAAVGDAAAGAATAAAADADGGAARGGAAGAAGVGALAGIGVEDDIAQWRSSGSGVGTLASFDTDVSSVDARSAEGSATANVRRVAVTLGSAPAAAAAGAGVRGPGSAGGLPPRVPTPSGSSGAPVADDIAGGSGSGGDDEQRHAPGGASVSARPASPGSPSTLSRDQLLREFMAMRAERDAEASRVRLLTARIQEMQEENASLMRTLDELLAVSAAASGKL